MIEWTKASYGDGQVADRVAMTTLEWVETVGKYHVYSCDNGVKIVVFDDQKKLLELVNSNLGSVFLIKLLLPSNNKYKYSVEIDGENEDVFTLARAAVVIRGTRLDARKLIYSHNDGLILVE
jgi:hypothetical protein